MNSKYRVYASLEGKPVDRNPVTVLYNQLYFQDHFSELTGRPQWQMQSWLYSTPDEYLQVFTRMIDQVPFEILQPELAPTRHSLAHTGFIEQDGRHYLLDRVDNTLTLLDSISGHAKDYVANETQHVFNKQDVIEWVKVMPATKMIASGQIDYIDAVVSKFGKDHFILSGGVVGVIYECGHYVGQTNALAMLLEQPELIDYLSQRITEQNIETIRALASAGGDAIYIDDATATSDMISASTYQRFSLPYIKTMVEEIHRLNHKAIVIYFGGVSDRLDLIIETGADGFAMETSMKNYTNDIYTISQKIGSRMTLFGNIDPLGLLQDGSDSELEAEINRQASAGRLARGFIMSTGSPITPSTPLRRVQRFLELARTI